MEDRHQVYNNMQNAVKQHKKQFAVLVDPDKMQGKKLEALAGNASGAGADYFFVGGSLLVRDCHASCVEVIKKNSPLPVILFPGNAMQITPAADAIFFLSLISGRNPELLIGQHVAAAPLLKESGLEVIPTGYIVVDGGRPTAVSYISNTQPVPADKEDIAACTALAGQMLGLRLIYMDAGSGAARPIPEPMIRRVRSEISIPVVAGGGIRTPDQAGNACRAGADVVVVGNALEKDPQILGEIAHAVHAWETVGP